MSAAIQSGGVALILGALAATYALLRIATRPVVGQALSLDVAVPLLIAGALLLVGLPAMYAAQNHATGRIGLVGHALLATGLLLLVVVAAGPILHPSAHLATGEHPVLFGLGIALTLGLLITGLATFWAGVLPRPAAVLLLAAMAGFAFVFFVAEFLPPIAGQVGTAVFGTLLMASFGWLGVALAGRTWP